METVDNLELLHLLRAGDESAFTRIYLYYWKPLFRTAFTILGDEEPAKDVVQNVFISLWQRRSEHKIENLKAYLQQAVRFAVFKAIREQKVTAAFYERLSAVTMEIIHDNPLIFKEQQELINRLINTLPANCREAYRLSREENLTYKQIALRLGISEKTVEKRLSRSLSHIRAGLSLTTCVMVVISAS